MVGASALAGAPQPGSVQMNSAGNPIMTSGGKECLRCN
jgi:hypothetical protein